MTVMSTAAWPSVVLLSSAVLLGCSDKSAKDDSTEDGVGGEEASESDGPEKLPWVEPDEPTPVENGTHRLIGPTTKPPPDPPDPPDEQDVPCDGHVYGVVRDFSVHHPDFEVFSGEGASLGMVLPELGADLLPVHTNDPALLMEDGSYVGLYGQQTNGATVFADWYRDADVNAGYYIELTFVETSDGVYSFGGPDFFPVDGVGFGNEGRPHNWHFTTEYRVEFEYREGAALTFTGDDDFWVFINGRLAIDLGGLHGSLSQELLLDEHATELGIELGQVYRLDLFHAERHALGSNFRVDTTLAFTNCAVFVGREE